MSNKKRVRTILAFAAPFVVLVFGVGFACQFHSDGTNARNTSFMAAGMIAALGVAASLAMRAESRGRIAPSGRGAKQPGGQQAIIRSRTAILKGLARLATTQDADELAHIDRACKYVGILAGRLAERDSDVDADLTCSLASASLLHEIGNVPNVEPLTPDPDQLTAVQTQLMQRFDATISDATKRLGNQISNDSFVELASIVARSKNERWDGRGDPGQLPAESIPIASRILALATHYDSLTARQPRKDKLSHAEATSILIEATGNQLEPRVVEAFLANHKRFEVIADSPASQQAVAEERVAVVALFDEDAADLACQPDSVSR